MPEPTQHDGHGRRGRLTLVRVTCDPPHGLQPDRCEGVGQPGDEPDDIVVTHRVEARLDHLTRRFYAARVVNNDTRTHNVRIFDPKMDVDSGAQEPGETVEIRFPQTGEFLVSCAIHPKMELWVDVTP
jgi:hypothetical protein